MIIPFSMAENTTGQLDTVNDANVGTISTIVAGLTPYAKQFLGTIIIVDNVNIKASAALLGGYYQYVQYKDVTNDSAGGLTFWDTNANSGNTKYNVTTVSSATNITQAAGIILNASITALNYSWQQVGLGGLALVLMKGSITDTTIGDIVFVDVTPSNTCDAQTEASVTARQLSKRIGTAYNAPASSTKSKVWVSPGGAWAINI